MTIGGKCLSGVVTCEVCCLTCRRAHIRLEESENSERIASPTEQAVKLLRARGYRIVPPDVDARIVVIEDDGTSRNATIMDLT